MIGKEHHYTLHHLMEATKQMTAYLRITDSGSSHFVESHAHGSQFHSSFHFACDAFVESREILFTSLPNFQFSVFPEFKKMPTVVDIVQLPFNVFVLLLLLPALLIDFVSCLCRWVCCILAICLHGAFSGNLGSTFKFLAVSQLSGAAKLEVTQRMADAVATVKS